MKYAQRSTAAIAAATLVGTGGIAAAVTGVANASHTGSDADSTTAIDKTQRDALSAMLHDLAGSSRKLDWQLRKAQRDLTRQTRELQRQRALSQIPLTVPSSTAGTTSAESDDHFTGDSSDETDDGSDETTAADDETDDPTTPPSSQPAPPPPTDTSTGASGGSGDDGEGDDDGNETQPTTGPGGDD
jgi:hypothetical protein